MSGRDDRVIVFEDGSSITLVCDVDWWSLPVSTIAAIREAVDTLASLGTVADRSAPATSLGQYEFGPGNQSENAAAPVAAQVEPVVHSDLFMCPRDSCDRVFTTKRALGIHESAHKKRDRADEHVDVTPSVAGALATDDTAIGDDAITYSCHTCATSDFTDYTTLAEHTQHWHQRHPTTRERRGEEPDVDVAAAHVVVDVEIVEADPEPPAKAYRCDDCTEPIEDGRALFKHAEKAHGRPPHQWERQMRTAAERASA